MTPPARRRKILDACCGSRMFWFNKKHPDALYIDNRTMAPTKQTNGATITVAPDEVMDFRKLGLPDESFSLVVFDPLVPDFTNECSIQVCKIIPGWKREYTELMQKQDCTGAKQYDFYLVEHAH